MSRAWTLVAAAVIATGCGSEAGPVPPVGATDPRHEETAPSSESGTETAPTPPRQNTPQPVVDRPDASAPDPGDAGPPPEGATLETVLAPPGLDPEDVTVHVTRRVGAVQYVIASYAHGEVDLPPLSDEAFAALSPEAQRARRLLEVAFMADEGDLPLLGLETLEALVADRHAFDRIAMFWGPGCADTEEDYGMAPCASRMAATPEGVVRQVDPQLERIVLARVEGRAPNLRRTGLVELFFAAEIDDELPPRLFASDIDGDGTIDLSSTLRLRLPRGDYGMGGLTEVRVQAVHDLELGVRLEVGTNFHETVMDVGGTETNCTTALTFVDRNGDGLRDAHLATRCSERVESDDGESETRRESSETDCLQSALTRIFECAGAVPNDAVKGAGDSMVHAHGLVDAYAPRTEFTADHAPEVERWWQATQEALRVVRAQLAEEDSADAGLVAALSEADAGVPSEAETTESDAGTARPEGPSASVTTTPTGDDGCPLVVLDPTSPLRVRTEPSTRSEVRGELPDGTVVVSDRSEGRFVHLTAPIEGWAWGANLVRRCP